ncbi:CsgG/HfaB family protein, partial [Escherichia coli]|uniref:CsgG/HfaB family protein n=1 Tax=Escherichia coli TaxID=562 RepID=UPI003D76E7C0
MATVPFSRIILRSLSRFCKPWRSSGINQLDQIAVNLRVVNVSTGEILSSVNTSNTILSYEVQAGVFRFIDY